MRWGWHPASFLCVGGCSDQYHTEVCISAFNLNQRGTHISRVHFNGPFLNIWPCPLVSVLVLTYKDRTHSLGSLIQDKISEWGQAGNSNEDSRKTASCPFCTDGDFREKEQSELMWTECPPSSGHGSKCLTYVIPLQLGTTLRCCYDHPLPDGKTKARRIQAPCRGNLSDKLKPASL